VCSSASCCAELTACMLSADCANASNQWDACWQGANAGPACDTQFAASGPDARTWYTCLVKFCASECEL
jgi:hypothetical protein